MKDKLVNWGNKAARLQIGIDMNTINISVSRLEEQLEVEKGIVKALEEAKEKKMKLISSVNFFIIPGNFIVQTAAISFIFQRGR